MIKGNIKKDIPQNASQYLKTGLKYLKTTNFASLENGKHEVLGNRVFAIVQEYNSKPLEEGRFEAHKKYIDIQYIIKGEEQIGVGYVGNFTEETDYDEEKDIVFLTQKPNTKSEFIKLKQQEFVILTQHDAHMPSISINETKPVRKVVVKVLAS